ncbi:MAG: glycosyltransferase family 4 protein [Candidatus Saccharibacteria bacterium]
MKVLFMYAYYEPEVAASMYLWTNLCEDLANNGVHVELFTPVPTRGISQEVRNSYKKLKHETKCGGNLVIHRVSIPREGKNSVLRALRYIWQNAIYIYKALITKTDLIYLESTPPTQGAMGAIIKKFKKVPVIYDLQDIFPDSLVNTGLTKKNSLLYRIGLVIENFSYRNMDKIIVISEDFKANIMAKGVPEEKIEIIYNWVDEDEVVPIERRDNILIDRYGLDRNKFYVSYSGNIGLTQNVDMLIEVAKELENERDICFLIIGDGVYKQEMDRQIREHKLSNIVLLPFQPYEDIAHVFSLGDVGLVISKANIGQNSVPSKTWSIMSAARPVLASFDSGSELSRIIETTGCGISVEAEDKDALKKAILRLYADKESRIEMGRKGREYIHNNLSRKVGSMKKVNLIESMIREKGSGLGEKGNL